MSWEFTIYTFTSDQSLSKFQKLLDLNMSIKWSKQFTGYFELSDINKIHELKTFTLGEPHLKIDYLEQLYASLNFNEIGDLSSKQQNLILNRLSQIYLEINSFNSPVINGCFVIDKDTSIKLIEWIKNLEIGQNLIKNSIIIKDDIDIITEFKYDLSCWLKHLHKTEDKLVLWNHSY